MVPLSSERESRPGDRVAVVLPAGVAFVEVFWALQLIGAVPCSFNPSVPEPTLSRRIELIKPRLILTEESVSELSSSAGAPANVDISPEDLALLQLTSGTSGSPRASMILQRNIMVFLSANRSSAFVGAEDVMVDWVPPWHDLGLVRFIIAPMHTGSTCHIVEPAVRTIPKWIQTISRHRATYSAAPDFALRVAARTVDPAQVDLSCLRVMKSGGEPARSSTIRSFENRFGLEGSTTVGYGLGEAVLGVTEHLPGDDVRVDERGNVSCGYANPGLELRAGSSVDEPDEILVRSEAVFAGYFEAPEETSRTLRDGWLYTGDSGYVDAGGRLYVLGRRSGMIKRGGALIAPRELEDAAHRVEAVRVAAAVSVPGQGDSEAIVVAVEADVSAENSEHQVKAAVTREVVSALGFAPSHVTVMPRRAIPRTENGKIRHARLRSLLAGDESGVRAL